VAAQERGQGVTQEASAPPPLPATTVGRTAAPPSAPPAEPTASRPRRTWASVTAVLGHRRTLRIGVVLVLVAAVVLRFWQDSPLWLDESQTVDIAGHPLSTLFSALREDGSPPLYYLVLHVWMTLFGTGNHAVRALSGLFSVAALPVAGLTARRYRLSDRAGLAALLVLATCPFAVRYATETRMYSLVLLLVLLALYTYHRVWSSGGWADALAAGVVTGALLLTQYWSLFLLVTAGIVTVVAWRRGHPQARRLVAPIVIGIVLFLPWLPSFRYQETHTGAPWGSPPGIGISWGSVQSWSGGGLTASLLAASYYVLIAVALLGTPAATGGLQFRRPFRRAPAVLVLVGVVTLAVGAVGGQISASAYSARYSIIGLAPVLLVVAAGFAWLPTRARTPALAVVCVFGLLGSYRLPFQLRTQAAQVAGVLEAAAPADLVVFCPDQLGPAVHRVAPNAGTQVVYPTFGSPAMVDWVNYKQRNESADPDAFAKQALQRATGHTVWLVYELGYRTFHGACQSLYTDFTVARGTPILALKADSSSYERDLVVEYKPR
jgi:mannosyltransferase